jgi:hypothetical protein
MAHLPSLSSELVHVDPWVLGSLTVKVRSTVCECRGVQVCAVVLMVLNVKEWDRILTVFEERVYVAVVSFDPLSCIDIPGADDVVGEDRADMVVPVGVWAG